MAGDGGRVPDVSEQRAEYLLPSDHRTSRNVPTMIFDSQAWVPATAYDAACNRASDPASVLAALLAESPEATVAAIEALLTSDEAARVAGRALAVTGGDEELYDRGDAIAVEWRDEALVALEAACRSLLSKAPKDDGDA
jgi:hypothetical protein